jgi:hypothetical protein
MRGLADNGSLGSSPVPTEIDVQAPYNGRCREPTTAILQADQVNDQIGEKFSLAGAGFVTSGGFSAATWSMCHIAQTLFSRKAHHHQ